MRVKELIEALNNCDQEKEVIFLYDFGYGKANCDVVKEEKSKVVITEKI